MEYPYTWRTIKLGVVKTYNENEKWRLSPKSRITSGLNYDTTTGEYLRKLDDGSYEVMFSPQSVTYTTNTTNTSSNLGQYMFDTNTFYPTYIPPTYDVIVKENTDELKKQLDDMFLYGDSNKPTGLLKEEKEMADTPNTCHLCGAGLLHTSHSRTFVKNHREYEGHTVYQCGTHIYTSHNEYDSGGTKKAKRHIHIGNDCVSFD